jgi:class 3 adenylate cyclase
MREVIRTYQNAVAAEVARFEGHVAKFMGDGVLAYFGWRGRTRTRPSGRCAPGSPWSRRCVG